MIQCLVASLLLSDVNPIEVDLGFRHSSIDEIIMDRLIIVSISPKYSNQYLGLSEITIEIFHPHNMEEGSKPTLRKCEVNFWNYSALFAT